MKIKLNSLRKLCKENIFFLIVLLFFILYYGWRLVSIAPWYDELYTFEHFIDAGPIYSATHWPLPNNHVFFSVLSGVLNLFTNNFIGLRGISYLSALFCLCGLYVLLCKCLNKAFALSGVLLYASLYLVNNLAIQGRGYSLTNACLILTLLSLYEICVKTPSHRFYLLFSLSLVCGLYTLVSSIYWVAPCCLAGGLFLLLHKNWKRLFQLVLAGFGAALTTLGLYGVLWGFMGADLIRNDITSGYFQENSLQILTRFPLYSVKKGILFMLSDGNVQSIDRSAFIHDFRYFARDIIGSFFLNKGYLFLGIIGFCLIGVLAYALLSRILHEEISLRLQFLLLFGALPIVLLPVILLIQSVYPFARVFSFLGIAIVLLFSGMLYSIISLITLWIKRWGLMRGIKCGLKCGLMRSFHSFDAFSIVLVCSCLVLALTNCLSSYYNAPYAAQDEYAKEVIEAITLEAPSSILTTDSYCRYEVYFYLLSKGGKGLALVEDQETPDILLLNKAMLASQEDNWSFTTTANQLPQDWIDSSMQLTFENEMYLLYEKK